MVGGGADRFGDERLELRDRVAVPVDGENGHATVSTLADKRLEPSETCGSASRGSDSRAD